MYFVRLSDGSLSEFIPSFIFHVVIFRSPPVASYQSRWQSWFPIVAWLKTAFVWRKRGGLDPTRDLWSLCWLKVRLIHLHVIVRGHVHLRHDVWDFWKIYSGIFFFVVGGCCWCIICGRLRLWNYLPNIIHNTSNHLSNTYVFCQKVRLFTSRNQHLK